MTTTKQFDLLNRLTNIASVPSVSSVVSFSYSHNAANQRTIQTRTDSSYVNYSYDNIGQLKTAIAAEAGGAPRLQEQLGYAYDLA